MKTGANKANTNKQFRTFAPLIGIVVYLKNTNTRKNTF